MPTNLYRPYNESQFSQQIASLTPKIWELYIEIPIFIMRIPEMRKDCHHHIVVPQWLQRLTILNTNAMMPPSLPWLHPALPQHPKFIELCIVDLSMSEISGFADDGSTARNTIASVNTVKMQRFWVNLIFIALPHSFPKLNTLPL